MSLPGVSVVPYLHSAFSSLSYFSVNMITFFLLDLFYKLISLYFKFQWLEYVVIRLLNLSFCPLSPTYRCKIIDKHLAILAKKHVETKFIKLNVEKAPFLTERLRIKVIPTLALLLDGKTKDYVVGFTDLGNTDDFPTEMLEWRLGCADVINYR